MTAATMLFRAILGALVLACSAVASAQTAFRSAAPFELADTVPRTSAPDAANADPALYDAVTLSSTFSGDTTTPYMGTAVNFASPGGAPQQAKITGVRLYAYALQTGVYQRIKARFRFWNAHRSAGTPVFTSAASSFVVDMDACPCNFVANRAYSVAITLPKPVYLESKQGVGFSQEWLIDYGDGNFVPATALVPALAGNAPATGTNLADYGNAGRSPDDLNFAPADALPSVNLAVRLDGSPFRLVQCSGASGYREHFNEEFDDATAFGQRWDAQANNGSFTVGSGFLALTAPDNAAQFPYVHSKVAMLPASGNFSVRWLARYDGVGGAGDGELAIDTGVPVNGTQADDARIAARSWQDVDGYEAYVKTGGPAPDPPISQVGLGAGTTLHDLEYCWLDNTVELWKDGVRVFQHARTAQVQRPDSLWMGNPVVNGVGPWNAFTLFRVQAGRINPDDTIFYDSFH